MFPDPATAYRWNDLTVAACVDPWEEEYRIASTQTNSFFKMKLPQFSGNRTSIFPKALRRPVSSFQDIYDAVDGYGRFFNDIFQQTANADNTQAYTRGEMKTESVKLRTVLAQFVQTFLQRTDQHSFTRHLCTLVCYQR